MTRQPREAPQPGTQGHGGARGYQGRDDAGRVGVAVRCSLEPDHAVALPTSEGTLGVVGATSATEAAPAADVRILRAKLRELTLDHNSCSVSLGRGGSAAERGTMIDRRPDSSKPAPGHKVHPTLLSNLAAVRLDQV